MTGCECFLIFVASMFAGYATSAIWRAVTGYSLIEWLLRKRWRP